MSISIISGTACKLKQPKRDELWKKMEEFGKVKKIPRGVTNAKLLPGQEYHAKHKPKRD